MSVLTPQELLAQLINNANAVKAEALVKAEQAKAQAEAKLAKDKVLSDALLLASQYEAIHTASVDRVVELEKAAKDEEDKTSAQALIIAEVKSNFISAQGLLNQFDEAKEVQKNNQVEKDQLDFLSNFLVEQMAQRGL